VPIDDPGNVLQDRKTVFCENCFTFAGKSETRSSDDGLMVANEIQGGDGQ
jgi:hypothetical protein